MTWSCIPTGDILGKKGQGEGAHQVPQDRGEFEQQWDGGFSSFSLIDWRNVVCTSIQRNPPNARAQRGCSLRSNKQEDHEYSGVP